MENSYVFVYGTLRRGGSNHHRMDGAVFMADAVVKGRLYELGWYPGLVIDPEGGSVIGEVYQVDAVLFDALDGYEGPEYRKSRVQAAPTDGQSTLPEVLLWEWDGPVDGLRSIPSGDWLERIRPEAGR